MLVAWKETREARRAVVDAMPFLTAAERVVVLAIHEDKDGDPDERERAQRHVEDVVAMLSRHGVAALAEVALRAGKGWRISFWARPAGGRRPGRRGRLRPSAPARMGPGRRHPRPAGARPICCLLSH